MAFGKDDRPTACNVVSHDATFETKNLSILPNGRAETLVEDEDGNEYYAITVYKPYCRLPS